MSYVVLRSVAEEGETRHKNSVKSEDQGTNTQGLQDEGAKTESKPVLLYFQP